jgi:hypothetical protein
MPFHLYNFTGGLGNQIFQVATLISLAKKYNTTFSFPRDVHEIERIGFPTIKVYQDKIFSEFTNHKLYKKKDDKLNEHILYVAQFQDINIDENINKSNTNIIMVGLPMSLSLFENNLEDISNIFLSKKQKLDIFLPKNDRIKICIGIRTFDEEKHNEWMTPTSYYKEALIKMINELDNKDVELHVFADRENVSSDIIFPILKDIKREDINLFEYFGKRDGVSDVQHFFLMMDCDHYIIGNSTFHYWPAIIASPKSITMFAQQSEWFSYIVSKKWIKL